MKRALILALALSACATTSRPSLNVQRQTVVVDHPVACLKPEDLPKLPCAWSTSRDDTLRQCLGPRPADARQALDLALAKLLEWIDYASVADPMLKGCATVPAAK